MDYWQSSQSRYHDVSVGCTSVTFDLVAPATTTTTTTTTTNTAADPGNGGLATRINIGLALGCLSYVLLY